MLQISLLRNIPKINIVFIQHQYCYQWSSKNTSAMISAQNLSSVFLYSCGMRTNWFYTLQLIHESQIVFSAYHSFTHIHFIHFPTAHRALRAISQAFQSSHLWFHRGQQSLTCEKDCKYHTGCPSSTSQCQNLLLHKWLIKTKWSSIDWLKL